jgi:hypothetical protein
MSKITVVIGTSVLSLFLGTAISAHAQHGPQQGGSEKHEDHGRGHERREHERRREVHDRQDQREHGNGHAQMRSVEQHDERGHGRDVWQDHRARNWAHEHRSWHERGGYRGYRIPESRFRANFGRAHWFRVHRAPILVVGGYPRFQYGGFWFSVVDPWPEYWASTWYETDDVYVDYVNDGYYMFNRRHPGVSIAINVSM